MYVLTVDQRRSRRDVDRVEQLLADLNKAPLLRPFERTAGDEVQAVTDNARLVVTIALDLIRRKHWSVGIGVGAVEAPLPASTRAGRGPAFESARLAVNAAKTAQVPVAIVGESGAGAAAESAQTALVLTGLIVARRSPQGQVATGLMDRGMSQAEVADLLGITKQAVSQRLTTAAWQPEVAGRSLCERLLREADK
ncbi:transcriptional regulator [Tomitella biformata]|uniref:transcriptional regulator n=1 Tax=Tomitella biformata TaxID=630403 RepID=UPI0004632D7A|nr:transcriptional regulator [Tomitella biformata]